MKSIEIASSIAKLNNAKTIDGGISVIAEEIHLSGDMSTNAYDEAGPVSLEGDLKLSGNTKINTDALKIDSNIEFKGNIDADNTDNNRTLDATAGTGKIDFQGDIGLSEALKSINVNSGTTNIKNVKTRDGGIYVTSSSINLDGYILTNALEDAGSVNFDGSVTLFNNSSINTDATNEDANVIFSNVVNADDSENKRTLDVATGTGIADFQGDIGISEALESLNISSKTTNLKNVKTREGGINIISASINLDGNISTDDYENAGNVIFDGDVNLADNIEIDTDAETNDANIVFTNEVNSDSAKNERKLEIESGTGNVNFQKDIGSTQAINKLEIKTANETNLKKITTRSGGINIVSNKINLEGDLSSNSFETAGDIKLEGAVNLKSNVTIDSDADIIDANISIIESINADEAANERKLLIHAGDGNADLQQSVVGSSQALKSLEIISSVAKIGNLKTRNEGLDIKANTVDLSGNISTDDQEEAGEINIEGSVILSGNTTINSDATETDANVIFTDVINADSAINERKLIISSGTGNIDFTKDIGTIEALNEVNVISADTTNVQNVETGNEGLFIVSQNINLNGNISTNTNERAGEVNLNGSVNLKSNVTINTDAELNDADVTIKHNIDADDAGNERMLIIHAGLGNVDLQSAQIGEAQALKSIEIVSATSKIANLKTLDGGVSIKSESIDLDGNISTNAFESAGNVNFDGAVILSDDTIIDTNATKADANVIFTKNINGNSELEISTDTGIIDFQNDISVKKLDIKSAATTNFQNINTGSGGINVMSDNINISGNLSSNKSETAGDIKLEGAVNLKANIIIDSDAASADANVIIVNSIDADNADSNRRLKIEAGTAIVDLQESNIGSKQALESIDIESSIAKIDNVKTRDSGISVVADEIHISGDISTESQDIAGDVSFEGDVKLVGNTTINTDASTTDSNVDFKGSIDADNSENERTLVIKTGAGHVNFQNDIGSTQALKTVSINSGSTNIKNVKTLDGGISVDSSSINIAGDIFTNIK